LFWLTPDFLCTLLCLTSADRFRNSNLKILQITSAQSLGGGERHLVDLTHGLSSRGHDVYLALRTGSPLISELPDLPKENITALPLRNSLDVRSARELSRLVRKNKIQIVHAHMARDYPLAAYATHTNPGTRLIITRHVLFALNRMHRITFARAARIIAVSNAVASRLQKDGIAPVEKISVVLNGIDTQRFLQARANFQRGDFLVNWKLPQDVLLVGTVGELTPLKGQREFLRAAAEVVKQVPETHFIVAGVDHSRDNKYRTRLEQLIEELNLTTQVKLVGWVDDLAQLYCALDVFVSASHTESFGLAIAEAMTSGTAVVATETEGAVEIIKNGETGILVSLANVDKLTAAILLLLKKKEERFRLGEAAQEAASARFSVERMVAETEEVYRSALAQV
jgi:glycosyltransferase involved in cell wall biosynthesis